jgi:signal peptidase I
MRTESDNVTRGGRRPPQRIPKSLPRVSPRVSPGAGPAERRRPRFLLLALVPVLVVLALRVWVVEPFTVSSDSMEPTIASGSVVLLYKPSAAADSLRNGVVVAFTNPLDGQIAIKRVIAGEGQSVAIRDAELYVDDVAVPERFIDHSRIDATYFGPVTVSAGSIFVLGDNRGVSIDSRDFGAIPLTSVQGTLLTGQK